jgi:hypothetical protein
VLSQLSPGIAVMMRRLARQATVGVVTGVTRRRSDRHSHKFCTF